MIVFVVLLAIITSLFVAIQDPIIQQFAVRFAGGYLSEKTGADIKVGRLAVAPDFRVFIDDVTVKDLNGNNLAKIGTLRTKIGIPDLLDGKIHLENVELQNTQANIIKYEGEDKFNFNFLVDAFGSNEEKPDKEPMPIIVDNISLKNIDFVFWNQNSDKPEKTENRLMDYSHIGLDDIHLKAEDFFMLGDSIHARISLLSAKEISGLELKDFKTDAVVCSKGIFLDGLKMETNNSLFDLDLHMLYDDYSAFNDFVNKVNFDATIRPTDILLSDIGVFTPVMYKMQDRVLFESRFTGPIEYFRVDDLVANIGNSTTIRGNLSMHPLDFENGEHTMNIKKMHFTYDDLVNFYIPSSTKTIPLPESLRPLNEGIISLDFKGSYNDFASNVSLKSGIGNIDASIARSKDGKGNNQFSGYVDADRVKAGSLANISKYVGDLDLNAGFTVKFPKKGGPEFLVDGQMANAQLLGKHIDMVKLDGDLKENRFNGKIKVDDDDLFLDFNGLIDFRNKKHPKSDFTAVIRNANLNALHLLKEDSISEITTKVYVNMTGFDLDDLEGEVRLDSTLYRDSRGSYFMKDFTGSIIKDNLMQRRIDLNCDFFDFKMAGQINFASLMMSLNEYVDSFVHFPIWDDKREAFRQYSLKHNVDQDFIVQLALKDTETLSQLLMPSVSIAKNTTLNGNYTSRINSLDLTLRSKNVQVGKLNFNDLELKNFNFRDAAFTSLKLDEIKYNNISESDTLELGLENISIVTRMTNDTVFAHIKWDDHTEEDHDKAEISTYFHPHENGGIFSITEADILVKDSVWTVSSDNFIDLIGDREIVSNLIFSHNKQSIRVDGYVPNTDIDTLTVQLRQFDLSNLDFLFINRGLDIDGFISGDAMVNNVKNAPMLLADLKINQLGVNGDIFGDAVIESLWNNEDKSVDLDASIFNEGKRTFNVTGSYFTKRKNDNLDFTIEMDSLRLNALSPFLAGEVSRLQGYGLGLVNITGSPEQPQIDGKLTLAEAGCKVAYLNTFYTFNPTILIDNKTISFENMVLVDTLGNKAQVEGRINHNNLKDFNLDLKLHPRNFLALATTGKENSSFYGTAVANGLVTVRGPFNDIYLDIKAGTQKGTNLTIPLNRTSTVKDNDFIIFINPNAEEEEEEVKQDGKVKSNFALNLDIDATDDATLKIMLPGNIGTIDASGNGNVKMSTSTSEDFKMFGGYTIKNGRFQLDFKGLVSKTFNLKQGGTITWSGNPTDGRIDATGVYSVKTPLSTLGIQVDSTSSTNNNVNVECLIHLKNALLNPTITFGMNLPNATEDITQTVYSLIDTTNQSVMTTQALSLLILGQFAYAGTSGSSELNLAGLFGATMQVDITDNLNLGVRYQSGSADSYDEYQIALRTELFENRLTIETNLGVISGNNSSETGNASNIVGEFDLYYKLSKDGRLLGHFYNHSNYNSNFNSFAIDRRAPYTQGLGLSYSRSFNTFGDLLRRRNKFGTNQPLLVPKKKETN